VTHENLLLGGSANVLHNIYALNGQATICGIIGRDQPGDQIIKLLEDLGSSTAGTIRSPERPTTIKTRIIARHQQVVRFDREATECIDDTVLKHVLDFFGAHLGEFQAVIVSDYAKGIICDALMLSLQEELQKQPHIPLIVDPKPSSKGRLKGATLITPNHHEAEQMSGIKIVDESTLQLAGTKLLEELESQAVLITRGEAGMSLFEKGKPMVSIPTMAKEVFDVTGAGDTVIATLSLGLAAGLSFVEAATIANLAAGIVVGKVGTATANIEELLGALS
jgi:D-beta-D-heptose 7-phosphate kinase/D-beta-D-heptose 1-phosphate adenosyltransferase